MKVHFNRVWGIVFIILGIILLGLHLFLISLGTVKIFQLCLSVFIIVVGFLYLYQPYFELRNNELVLFNLMGMELRNYKFNSLSEFNLDGNKIYLEMDGKMKRIRLNASMAKTEEWEQFISLLKREDFTNELHNI